MAPFLYLRRPVETSKPILFLLALTLFISACTQPTSEYQNLSEKPPLSIIPHTQAATESVIQTHLRIPLGRLRERLEADIPTSLYNDPGKIKQKCIRIFGKNLCETYQVGGWAERTGPIQLTPLNNGFLRVKIPLQYKLNVQGNGKIVRELLRNIDFKTASFTVIADLKPWINKHWQLQLAASTAIHWNQSPRVEVFGVNLDIQSNVEKPIQKALGKVLQKQQQRIAADNRFRQRIEAFWTTLQTPRKISDNIPVWLQTDPQALSLSTIRIDSDAIHLALSLRTILTTFPRSEGLNKPIKPLLMLSNRSVGKPTISLNLPLALSYQDLANTLQQRLSQQPLTYQQDKIRVSVKSIDIYPSNGRLVLAAKVRLSGLADLLTSEGEIYISGKPIVDNQTKTLKLVDVTFSRQLDSVFWRATTSLLHKQLLAGLQKSLVYDFSERYSAMQQSINQQLQAQHKKLKLNGQLRSLTIQDIQLDLDQLRLILDATGTVNVEMTNL
ncbi:MAG: DUF4403 family protein [Leucothrix sp.]